MSGSRQAPRELTICYRPIEPGMHMFWSEQLPGLNHAHSDLRRAFDTLEEVVNYLARRAFTNAGYYQIEGSFTAFKKSRSGHPEVKMRRLAKAPTEAAQQVA